MWKKVKRNEAAQRFAKPARKVPGVARNRTGTKGANAIFPISMVTAERCDVYSDGGNRLAFSFSPRGEYVVKKDTYGKSGYVTIPHRFASRIPYGTTDVDMEPDGDMWVLDLRDLSPVSVAAE